MSDEAKSAQSIEFAATESNYRADLQFRERLPE